jgi:hypothetical protein
MKCWGASVFNVAMATDICQVLLSRIKIETQTEFFVPMQDAG